MGEADRLRDDPPECGRGAGPAAGRTSARLSAAALAIATWTTLDTTRAHAQTRHDVLVASHIPVNSGAGTVSLGPGAGSNDGVQGIDCQGATPTGGGNIPAQVVTDLQATATILRILHNDGTGLVGAVEVNCTIDSQSPTVVQTSLSKSR